MKVGDLVRPIKSRIMKVGKTEIIEIQEGFLNRIRVKYHGRTTMSGCPLHSWENAIEWEVDIQRMRDEKLKELGI